MAAVLARYLAFTERRPLFSKIATAGTLTTAGDLLAQGFGDKPLDLQRTLRLAMWGFAWGGPTMHVWWKFLDKRFGARGLRPAVYKAAADQLIFSPPGLIVFFTYMGLTQGHSFAQIKEKIRQDYWPTMFANWAVWPAVQLFNFTVIPPSGRVLFVSTIAVAWNAFLSMQGNKPVVRKQEAAEKNSRNDDDLIRHPPPQAQSFRTPLYRAN